MEAMDGSATPSILVLVLGLAGVVISLWALVELGFLPGTKGENRFGPDPKA